MYNFKNSYTINQLKAITIMKSMKDNTLDYNIAVSDEPEYENLLEEFINFSILVIRDYQQLQEQEISNKKIS